MSPLQYVSDIFQGALSGLIVSTVVIFWIVIGAYVYQAPLPELPFDTSGCEEEVTGIFNSYITNIIDLRNLSHTAEKYLQLAENDDWYVTLYVFRPYYIESSFWVYVEN